MPAVPSEDQHERHEASQTQMLKDRRFKLNRACDRCRRRRIRCEESTPCASCVAAGSPCTFEEPGKKSHPHKSKRTSTLEERMAQLEALIQSMPANIFQGTGEMGGGGSDVPPSSTSSEFPSTSFPPLAPFPMMGVPPPSFKLMNPATHFVPPPSMSGPASATDSITAGIANVTLSPTYLYWDDEGFTRWQGAASGLPLLDMLVERIAPPPSAAPALDSTPLSLRTEQKLFFGSTNAPNTNTQQHYFPDRPLKRRVTINPETLWKTVTSAIAPDLMDGLVQSYLSTTFYLMPFLHIPTFLHDYSNPTKWGEPGFVSFVTAICCLASRHVDDKRVREDPNDPFSSGTHWFGLFNKLRSLPAADRPTLYTVQAVLVAAVYAVGLGRLSKGFALLSAAATLSIDAGLHRSVDAYDCFDPIEREVRKRTFWSVYMWDKQVGAAFGRPPMIRLRDCDVPEPSVIDDEGVNAQSGIGTAGSSPRMAAFVAAIRYYVVLESVLDAPPSLNPTTASSFLGAASMTLVGFRRNQDMHEEEALLDEAVSMVPSYWAHAADGSAIASGNGDDVIQTTQTHRLHCMEQWVRMLIHRQRLTVAIANGADEEAEVQEMIGCHQAAVNIIHSQLQMATHGLMGFFGVGAIHQLNQAGRTLVAVILSCRSASPFLQKQFVEPGLEALRSCVVLLRRFSVRYLCGLRSSDLIEEFCRISKVPLDAPPFLPNVNNPAARRAWLRPVRKKTTSIAGSGTTPSDSGSPSNHINPNGTVRDESQPPNSDTSLSSLNIGSMSPPGNGMPNLSLNTSSPGPFSNAAYDAYDVLINPPGPSKGSQSMSMGGMSSGTGNGPSKGSSYGQMDGADLLSGSATDDILALLSNSNFETPFDFGMLYSTDGNGVNAGGVNGDVGGSMNGMGGMFSTPSPLNYVNGSSVGSGSTQGTGTYDSRDQTGQGFKMGTV